MSIDFRVNKERFPYDVYVEGNRIAVLYSSHAVSLMENTVKCNELVLELSQRVNRLIAVAEGRRIANPEDLVPIKEVRYSSLSLSAPEILQISGIEVGQVYKWAHAETMWKVTSLSGLAQVATLAWIEDPSTGKLSTTYTKSVDFARLKKVYTLVQAAKGDLDGSSDDIQDEVNPDSEEALEELGV